MINKAILLGNLGNDPEFKTYGENGVLKFRMATSRSYKNKEGEWQEETTWHTCEMWRKSPPKGLVKGCKVYVEGEINHREYEGKCDTTIKLQTLRNLTPQETTQPTQQNRIVEEEDDLPF